MITMLAMMIVTPERIMELLLLSGVRDIDKEQFPTYSKRYKTIRWGKDLQIWIVEEKLQESKYLEDGPNKTTWGKLKSNGFMILLVLQRQL